MLIVVGIDHRSELGSVVHAFAVVEDDTGHRSGQLVDLAELFECHFGHSADGEALASTLHTEEADGVALVQVDGNLALVGNDLAEDAVLRRIIVVADEHFIFGFLVVGVDGLGVGRRAIVLTF